LAFSHQPISDAHPQKQSAPAKEENTFSLFNTSFSFIHFTFLGFSVAFSVHVNGTLPMYSFAIWLHETQPEDSQN
jgi:hypothetical protein